MHAEEVSWTFSLIRKSVEGCHAQKRLIILKEDESARNNLNAVTESMETIRHPERP